MSVSGINFKKEELAGLEGIKDTWFIIGQTEGTDDSNLFFRRTWIIGKNTQLQGMILDFAWGANPYENNWNGESNNGKKLSEGQYYYILKNYQEDLNLEGIVILVR